jgi:3-oxoacyl-[acyl-carrier protein] reductase
MFALTGKTAIVTGASRGIGRAIALALASRGAHVVAVARGDNAAATVDAIRAADGSAESASVDVTDADAFTTLVKAVAAARGRIDVLVNNAGITRDQLALRLKREDWDQVIATNLTASFTCAQAVLPAMVRQRAGRIISISSVVGQMGNAGQTNYAASKAGIIGFSKALAREVASRQVTVNVVAPGMIDTDMTKAVAEKAKIDWAQQIPMGRVGTPEEVAATVCFLASDEASYITGQVLAVNGGMYT